MATRTKASKARKPKKTPKKKPVSRATQVAEQWLQIARQRGMTDQPPGTRDAGKSLWRLLEDPLTPVRHAAGFALAALRDPALVQAFILALEGASNRDIARAVLTLGEAGFTNAAPYIASSFTRDDPELAGAFARALGLLAESEAAPMLVDALDSDFVPTEAAEALGRLNDLRAVPALVRALSHKKDTVRAAAAYSLGCLGALEGEEEAAVMRELARLEADASQRVQLCAAVARFERGDSQGLHAIHTALHTP